MSQIEFNSSSQVLLGCFVLVILVMFLRTGHLSCMEYFIYYGESAKFRSFLSTCYINTKFLNRKLLDYLKRKGHIKDREHQEPFKSFCCSLVFLTEDQLVVGLSGLMNFNVALTM